MGWKRVVEARLPRERTGTIALLRQAERLSIPSYQQTNQLKAGMSSTISYKHLCFDSNSSSVYYYCLKHTIIWVSERVAKVVVVSSVVIKCSDLMIKYR